MSMFYETWQLLKDTVISFIDDEALSRGAAIAFFTVTSIAPVRETPNGVCGLDEPAEQE